MCSHYQSVKDPQRLRQAFGVEMPAGVKAEVWPGYHAVFIRRPQEADSGDEAVP